MHDHLLMEPADFDDPNRSMTDDERLELGKQVFEMAMQEGTYFQKHIVTEMLEERGFEVGWAQGSDDILLMSIWRYGPDPEHPLLDEFIVEFTGFDAAIITVFCPTRTTSL